MIERIPWGLIALCLSALSLLILEVPKIFNPYLGSLSVTLESSGDVIVSPLLKIATNFNHLYVDSDLPVLKKITPVKIAYNEITHHDIYHMIGKFPGAPAAVHDMVETMANARIDTLRAFTALAGLAVVMALIAFSAKSRVYIKVPSMDVYSALKENLEAEDLVVYEDETNIRRLFVVGGFAGLGIFAYLSTILIISLKTVYTNFNVLMNAMMHLKYGKNLASLQFNTHWQIGVATILFLSALTFLLIGSLIYTILGFSAEDRPINFASELISVPTKFFKFRISKSCGADLKEIDNLNMEQGREPEPVDTHIVIAASPTTPVASSCDTTDPTLKTLTPDVQAEVVLVPAGAIPDAEVPVAEGLVVAEGHVAAADTAGLITATEAPTIINTEVMQSNNVEMAAPEISG